MSDLGTLHRLPANGRSFEDRGSGSGDSPFPALSQIVTTEAHGKSEWWRAQVVWARDARGFEKVADGKSRRAVLACQASRDCTQTYPTNIFLYFSVGPEDQGADTPQR
jgi:hypothetical protein